MAYDWVVFNDLFAELFREPVTSPIDEVAYRNLVSMVELETMNWEGIICIPFGSTIDINAVKNLATALYTAHIIVSSNLSYTALAMDEVKRVESLDNKMEFRDYKLNSKYDLRGTSYGVRLQSLLDNYSCKRIREEELVQPHTFAGFGLISEDNCGCGGYY